MRFFVNPGQFVDEAFIADCTIEYEPSGIALDECPNTSSECGLGYCGEAEGTDPISLLHGEKRETITDLVVNSPGRALSFVRSYRQSQQSALKHMGLGWTHNHNTTLEFISGSPNRITVQVGDGGAVFFEETSAGSNSYTAQASSAAITVDPNSTAARYTLIGQDQSVRVFDNTGRLREHTWPDGEVWTYAYYLTGHTFAGKLQSVSDDYGRQLQFTYLVPWTSAGTQLWRVGDHQATGLDGSTPSGRYVEYSYIEQQDDSSPISQPEALLEKVRDVRGQEWTYRYYGSASGELGTDPQADFLVEVKSPTVDTDGDGTADGELTLKQLDYIFTGSDLTGITQELGDDGSGPLKTVDYVFQAGGEEVTTETVAGRTIRHRFLYGNYVGPEDAIGHKTNRFINPQFRPFLMEDARGRVTQLAWDSSGKNLSQVTDAEGHETEFFYTTDDRLDYLLDAEGRQTEYTYGDSNVPRQPTVIKVYQYVGGPLLRHQEFDYDLKGRTTEERLIDPADGTTVLQQTIRSYYSSGDGNGLLESLTVVDVQNQANNTSTVYTYDSAGRVIKTQKTSLFGSCEFSYTVYDPAGNVVATVCGRQNATPPTTVAEALAMYDPQDSVKKHNRVTVHEYDTLGRRVKTVSNAGMDIEQTSLTAYDALDRVIRTIQNYVEDVSITTPYTAAHSAFDHGDNNDENLVSDTEYNERSQVSRRVDPEGNVSLYGYDDAGRLVKTIQNASSPNYDNSYGLNGDPDLSDYTPVADADRDIISQQVYDPVGNLVKIIDPLGRVAFTVYDALNRPVQTVRSASDPDYAILQDLSLSSYPLSSALDKDIVSTTVYDTMGRVAESQDAAGRVNLTVYDGLGRAVRTIQNYVAQGSPETDWHWSVTKWQLSSTDSTPVDHGTNNDQNIISDTIYDESGQVESSLSVRGIVTRFVYDGLGRTVRSIQNYIAQGSSDPVDWVWSETNKRWEYSSSDTTPIAHGTDEAENIIQDTAYDSDGQVQSTRDVLGRVSYNVYDGQGRPVRRVQNYAVQGSSSPADWVWLTDHWEDGASNPIAHRSDPTAHPNNEDQNLISDTVYDDQGRAHETMDTRGNISRTVFLGSGRILRRIQNYVSQGSTDPADWYWNGTNWQQSEVDTTPISHGAENNQNLITEHSYDLMGRVTQTRQPDLRVNHMVHDALGRQIRSIQNYVPQGTSDPAAWFWNGANWQYSSVDTTPINHGTDNDQNLVSETSYNKAGQALSSRDPRGTQTGFGYDSAGRRQSLTQAVGTALEATSYTVYDKLGQALRTIRNYLPQGTSSPADWVWDDLRQRWEDGEDHLIDHGPFNDRNLITDFAYDALGRRISSVNAEQDTTLMAYFVDGQVESQVDPEGGITQYRYDDLGRRTIVVQGYNESTDPAGWVWNGSAWETS